jgi:ATP-binding cassette subfamily C (CFTR/MRP) protein 4
VTTKTAHFEGTLQLSFHELTREWNKELEAYKTGKIKRPSILKAVVKTFGLQWLWYAQLAIWPEIVVRLAQPFMIRVIVVYLTQSIEDAEKPGAITYSHAVISSYILIISVGIWSVSRHHAFLLVCRTGINVRTALTALIFKKVLRVSKSSFEQTDVGQILNVLANDLYRFEDITTNLWALIIGPVVCIVGVYFVWYFIGIAALGGLVILLLFVPFQATMGRFFNKYRRQTTQITDKRVRLMNEIISAMKLIKVYCWEQPFAETVDQIRQKEIVSINRTYVLRGINGATSFVGTRIMLFASFVIYALMGNALTPEIVFVVMSLFNALRVPVMNQFTNAVAVGGECLVAEKRVVKLLLLEEKPERHSIQNMSTKSQVDKQPPSLERGSIKLENYVGRWTKSLTVNNLDEITLNINAGELIVVVGAVGSGKTCFLWALLNEIERISGSCSVNGSTSYAPQESWCFGGSIKQNILVGNAFLHSKYKEVIRCSGLKRDIKLFSEGDDTFVGEKGYTLSGGQKARVSLARCVYHEADIYLLDDPLSAVDPKVANHIFDRCIKEYLKGKTVVLVTHQLQFLSKADKIIVLKEGRAVAVGSYEQLSKSSVEFLSFLDQKQREEEKRKESLTKEKSLSLKSNLLKDEEDEEPVKEGKEGQLQTCRVKTSEESNRDCGSVSLSVYWQYLSSGGSVWLVYLAFLVALMSQGLYHYTDLWLSAWTEHTLNRLNANDTSHVASTVGTESVFNNETHNVLFYTMLVVVLFIGAFMRTSLTFRLCLKSSIYLHDRIFKRVLRAPMLFFENTPIGQILNRFTRDVGVVDQIIPSSLIDVNISILNSLGVIIMSCVVSPWLIIPCVIIGACCVPIRNFYIRTARELQRLDSIARSPIYSHISCTFDGLITVRAFNLERLFEQQYFRYLADSVSCRFLVIVAGRVIGVILDMFVTIYIAAICLLLVYIPKGTISGGDAGLILSASILLTGMFQWAVRLTAEFETQMVSAERIFEYGKLESEAELNIPGKIEDKRWPKHGKIVFERVFLRYSKDLPHVLKDINLTIEPGEHVGVVGRTGAGKSSLISVLFRLVEPEGKIIIDGVDTKTLGLHELREKISIIPQDPSLFSGSIRKNLDPFNEYDDHKIWQVLGEANLSPTIKNMTGELDALVSEGGSNLSVGQRQLLCLARSLLKNNKILVLDEATANVDQETDFQIQKTIKSKFSDMTVITVAHRLNTIIDMDKVVVMDAGSVVEFDSPYILLRNQSGVFHSMVKQTGTEFEKMLHKMAEKSYFDKAHNEPLNEIEINSD